MTNDENRPAGLCANCDNYTSCIFLRDTKVEIHACEEYSCSHSSTESKNFVLPLHAEQKTPFTNESISSRNMGLCINCENRKTCMYPNVDGGVWHCSDYC